MSLGIVPDMFDIKYYVQSKNRMTVYVTLKPASYKLRKGGRGLTARSRAHRAAAAV